MSQNYKDTLNLPRTDFPMKANLASREPELLKMWDETRLYRQIQRSHKDRELFVLHDGPPFANGDVHMGTALNKILKDFVVKSQTMRCVCAQVCRSSARAVQTARRAWRLGASVSDARSKIRSGNPARIRGLRRKRIGLPIKEAGFLEHWRADRTR